MSCLTSDTKIVYVAVLYDKNGNIVDEGCDCDFLEYAIENASELVANAVGKTNEHHSAKIEIRILPVYR